jgi:hypothetical protein
MLVKPHIKIIIMSAFFLGNFSCTENGEEKVKKLIENSLRNTSGIDANEFEKIRTLIDATEELKALLPNDSSIILKIHDISEILATSKRNPITLPIAIDTGFESGNNEVNNIHFFYENSSSMDGYLNGNTNFTDAVLGFLSKSDLKKDNINLYYINKEAYPVDSNIVGEFVDFLKPSNVKKVGGKSRNNSEINRILGIVSDTIINSNDRNTIGIVVSDYIYSIQGRDISKQLNFQKATTITNLKRLSEGNYAILIIKIESQFNGDYYNILNKGKKINEDRPFFIWVIGEKNRILNFPERYDIKKYKGYKEHLILFDDDNGTNPYYSILLESFRNGRFKKSNRSDDQITEIEDAKCGRDGIFTFSVAVDFSKIPISEEYIRDTSHYKIASSSGDTFVVNNILPIEKINNNDRPQRMTATHIITISTSKLSNSKQELNIELIKRVPKWVEDSSTECDTTDQQRKGKTFGFSYLVEGTKEVFGYNDKSNYFSLSIKIKK